MRATIATICLSLVWLCGPAAAEGEPAIAAVSYPALVRHVRSVEGFVPMEWRIEIKRSGDLNGDGRDDVALVLRATIRAMSSMRAGRAGRRTSTPIRVFYW